jgi:aspartyl-tRNA(Asn)/glutamyl-tRNA(Gln) amidotransferase subunit C
LSALPISPGLGIDAGNIDQYSRDLSEILDLVKKMDSVSTDNVEPLAHPQDIELRLRPDQVTEPNHRERLQNMAPATDQGLYLVPKIIE